MRFRSEDDSCRMNSQSRGEKMASAIKLGCASAHGAVGASVSQSSVRSTRNSAAPNSNATKKASKSSVIDEMLQGNLGRRAECPAGRVQPRTGDRQWPSVGPHGEKSVRVQGTREPWSKPQAQPGTQRAVCTG